VTLWAARSMSICAAVWAGSRRGLTQRARKRKRCLTVNEATKFPSVHFFIHRGGGG
jgi:hypothetical protein